MTKSIRDSFTAAIFFQAAKQNAIHSAAGIANVCLNEFTIIAMGFTSTNLVDDDRENLTFH